MTKPTPLEQTRRVQAASGRLIDLADSDFRSAGLTMPEELYASAWELWRSRPRYEPSGAGGARARRAVAEFLTSDGLPTEPEQVILTSGSSISYQLLFAALPPPRTTHVGGESIALPTPAYPLFEDLCRGAGLRPVWYRLSARDRYNPDRESLVSALTESPRAIVVISPNNPTGAIHDGDALADLVGTAAARGVPIISDEVFSAFRDEATLPRAAHHLPASTPGAGPIASLNGLSKLCAAPEVKLGWIALHGDADAVAALRDDLDTLHDTLLTVSGAAESFARVFLSAAAAPAREAIARGIDERRSLLGQTLSSIPGVHLEVSRGGVHLVFALTAELVAERFGSTDDETVARAILSATGVHVHPGYLYRLDSREGSIDPQFVISCVHDPDRIAEAGERLYRVFRS